MPRRRRTLNPALITGLVIAGAVVLAWAGVGGGWLKTQVPPEQQSIAMMPPMPASAPAPTQDIEMMRRMMQTPTPTPTIFVVAPMPPTPTPTPTYAPPTIPSIPPPTPTPYLPCPNKISFFSRLMRAATGQPSPCPNIVSSPTPTSRPTPTPVILKMTPRPSSSPRPSSTPATPTPTAPCSPGSLSFFSRLMRAATGLGDCPPPTQATSTPPIVPATMTPSAEPEENGNCPECDCFAQPTTNNNNLSFFNRLLRAQAERRIQENVLGSCPIIARPHRERKEGKWVAIDETDARDDMYEVVENKELRTLSTTNGVLKNDYINPGHLNPDLQKTGISEWNTYVTTNYKVEIARGPNDNKTDSFALREDGSFTFKSKKIPGNAIEEVQFQYQIKKKIDNQFLDSANVKIKIKPDTSITEDGNKWVCVLEPVKNNAAKPFKLSVLTSRYIWEAGGTPWLPSCHQDTPEAIQALQRQQTTMPVQWPVKPENGTWNKKYQYSWWTARHNNVSTAFPDLDNANQLKRHNDKASCVTSCKAASDRAVDEWYRWAWSSINDARANEVFGPHFIRWGWMQVPNPAPAQWENWNKARLRVYAGWLKWVSKSQI